jgi:hypothetical protein
MSYRRRSNARPYMTKARFDSTCPETGKDIKKGDDIAYFPALKKAYHSDSQSAETVRGLDFAEANGMADANY